MIPRAGYSIQLGLPHKMTDHHSRRCRVMAGVEESTEKLSEEREKTVVTVLIEDQQYMMVP